jgi:plasmid maintenance system antidote protein VapI
MKNKEFQKFLKFAGSQKEAARIMGVEESLVSMVATDHRNVSSAAAIRIVDQYPQLSLYRLLKSRVNK